MITELEKKLRLAMCDIAEFAEQYWRAAYPESRELIDKINHIRSYVNGEVDTLPTFKPDDGQWLEEEGVVAVGCSLNAAANARWCVMALSKFNFSSVNSCANHAKSWVTISKDSPNKWNSASKDIEAILDKYFTEKELVSVLGRSTAFWAKHSYSSNDLYWGSEQHKNDSEVFFRGAKYSTGVNYSGGFTQILNVRNEAKILPFLGSVSAMVAGFMAHKGMDIEEGGQIKKSLIPIAIRGSKVKPSTGEIYNFYDEDGCFGFSGLINSILSDLINSDQKQEVGEYILYSAGGQDLVWTLKEGELKQSPWISIIKLADYEFTRNSRIEPNSKECYAIVDFITDAFIEAIARKANEEED